MRTVLWERGREGLLLTWKNTESQRLQVLVGLFLLQSCSLILLSYAASDERPNYFTIGALKSQLMFYMASRRGHCDEVRRIMKN